MMTFKLPKELPTTACVFQITIGDKYYIGKSSNLLFVKNEIQNTYGKYNRGGVLDTNFRSTRKANLLLPGLTSYITDYKKFAIIT